MNEGLARLLASVGEFRLAAGEILGSSEGAVSERAYNAHLALSRVSELSLKQSDLLKQSVRCVEVGVFRASIVMAWAAVADLVLEIAVKESSSVQSIRNWTFADKAGLAETQAEHNIIQCLKDAGVISKSEQKSLHGMLHRRNECAHASEYFPGANEALGFLDECLGMARKLSKKL